MLIRENTRHCLFIFGDLLDLKIMTQFLLPDFVNREPYGAGNFKMLLFQFSSDREEILCGYFLPWRDTGYDFFVIGHLASFTNFVAL